MDRPMKPAKEEQRIRTNGQFENEETRLAYLIAVQGTQPLRTQDLIAALENMTSGLKDHLKQQEMEAAAAAAKNRTGLVGPDGSPISSKQKPKLVAP